MGKPSTEGTFSSGNTSEGQGTSLCPRFGKRCVCSEVILVSVLWLPVRQSLSASTTMSIIHSNSAAGLTTAYPALSSVCLNYYDLSSRKGEVPSSGYMLGTLSLWVSAPGHGHTGEGPCVLVVAVVGLILFTGAVIWVCAAVMHRDVFLITELSLHKGKGFSAPRTTPSAKQAEGGHGTHGWDS